MNIRKDIFLEILYSIVIAAVLLIEKTRMEEEQRSILEVLKNLILIAVYYLWIHSLSSKFTRSIFLVKKNHKRNTLFRRFHLTAIKEFSQFKIVVFIILCATLSIISKEFDFNNILLRVVQLASISIYVLTIYSALTRKSESVNFNWKFAIVLFAPYLFLFLAHALFSVKHPQFLLVIPGNLHLLFFVDINLLNLFLALLGLSVTLGVYTTSMNRLLDGKKSLALPIGKLN